MGRKDRLVFKTMVPRAARQAARVLTVSERTRRDLIEVYELADERIVVTPNGVDPAFSPGPARGTMRSSSAGSRSGRTRSPRSPPPSTPAFRSSSPGPRRTKISRASWNVAVRA